MFTGIIKGRGTLVAVARKKGLLHMTVAGPRAWRLHEGESISVNGICSTVHAFAAPNMSVFYMPETAKKTTVRSWKKGDRLNLERSLWLGDRLGGHVVMGHVEGVGSIRSISRKKGERLFTIEVLPELALNIVPKGSIALDGVSLTVVDAGEDWFSVALIPYTLTHTSLGACTSSSQVNVETDILARARLSSILKPYAKNGRKKNRGSY